MCEFDKYSLMDFCCKVIMKELKKIITTALVALVIFTAVIYAKMPGLINSQMIPWEFEVSLQEVI